MGISVLRGREFTSGDTENGPLVVLVNAAMAHTWWKEENPIGSTSGLAINNGELLLESSPMSTTTVSKPSLNQRCMFPTGRFLMSRHAQ